MEDDLNILIVEYLSNQWSDLPQILNLSLGDQTKANKLCDLLVKLLYQSKSWVELCSALEDQLLYPNMLHDEKQVSLNKTNNIDHKNVFSLKLIYFWQLKLAQKKPNISNFIFLISRAQ
jgi:hypothetical protein